MTQCVGCQQQQPEEAVRTSVAPLPTMALEVLTCHYRPFLLLYSSSLALCHQGALDISEHYTIHAAKTFCSTLGEFFLPLINACDKIQHVILSSVINPPKSKLNDLSFMPLSTFDILQQYSNYIIPPMLFSF